MAALQEASDFRVAVDISGQISEYWQIFIAIAGILGPIIIGLLVVYYARKESLTRTKELNFSLFEKRFAIYQHVRTFISEVCAKREVNMEDIPPLSRIRTEASFFFGDDFCNFLEKIFQDAVSIQRLTLELYGGAPLEQDVRQQKIRQFDEIMLRFHDYNSDLKQVVRRYLNFSDISDAGRHWHW